MNLRKNIHGRLLLVACLTPLLALSLWCGWNVYHYSNERAQIKDDFTEVNHIYYGILSVDSWIKPMKNILSKQLGDLSLSNEQDSLLRIQINELLNDMLAKADAIVQRKDNSFKGKVRKFAVNTFVNKDSLRAIVPEFTDVIMKNIKDPETKDRLRIMAETKVNELAMQTHDSLEVSFIDGIYARYGVDELGVFNELALKRSEELKKMAYWYAYCMIGIVLAFLLLWPLLWKQAHLRPVFLTLSVLLAFIVLGVGLSSPMLEIDARIGEFNFFLLGEQIVFHDQMLFYRSKSILQVVQILFQSGQYDSLFVGGLILAFSVILPVLKLVSNLAYLWLEKSRKYLLIQWLAFSSGKWSMADVFVVAIFMSYVAFNGIVENQLELLNRDTDQLKAMTTNYTATEPGFILFVTYVLFGLLLAELLKRVVKKQQKI